MFVQISTIADELLKEIETIIEKINYTIQSYEVIFAGLPTDQRTSALNLIAYLALRQHDLRNLQGKLARLGISSLGRSEPHVVATMERVSYLLHLLTKQVGCTMNISLFEEGARLLEKRTEALFGPPNPKRSTRIMVTLGGDPSLETVQRLAAQGMEVVRLNCAHDSPREWLGWINAVRHVERDLARKIPIFMDIEGAKLRVGKLPIRDQTITLLPLVDDRKQVLKPAQMRLIPESGEEHFTEDHPSENDEIVTLRVPDNIYASLEEGDTLHLTDIRGKERTLSVAWRDDEQIIVEVPQKTVISSQTIVTHHSHHGKKISFTFLDITGQPEAITVYRGDTIFLSGSEDHPDLQKHAAIAPHATLPVNYPEVLTRLEIGQRVWIDEGKIGGTVITKLTDGVVVRIDHAAPRGSTIKSGKSINTPGADLGLPPLTKRDEDHLNFIAAYADGVSFSFVHSAKELAEMVAVLRAAEKNNKRQHQLGVLAKIETLRGARAIGEILLEGLKHEPFGVMIARGDLAVELGPEYHAEIQEELLWVCEAAHVPVVWATQVLDRLAKKGTPSRPEITDAAASSRAECVMVNKGPYVDLAVMLLDEVLSRMAHHQHKKTPLLRALRIAQNIPSIAVDK